MGDVASHGRRGPRCFGKDVIFSRKRSDDFRKVFEVKDGTIGFAGPRCDNDTYIENIHTLIKKYDKSPYPHVALTWCLKQRGDPSWMKVGEQAKQMLEPFLNVQPHVIFIDMFYGWLLADVLGEKKPLEDTGFFVPIGERSYRPKNMPPG